MTVHEHSIAAYYGEMPKLSRRARIILAWFVEHGPATDRECMKALKFTDMNSVRPRITELIDAEKLIEVGQRICPVTHKKVRVSGIPGRTQAELTLDLAAA